MTDRTVAKYWFAAVAGLMGVLGFLALTQREPLPRPSDSAPLVPKDAPEAGVPARPAAMPTPIGPAAGPPRLKRSSAVAFGRRQARSSDGRFDLALLDEQLPLLREPLRQCHERALDDRPTIAGELQVAFRVDASGRVSEVSMEGLGDAPELRTCVEAAMRRALFPDVSKRALRVAVEITFSAL